MPFMMHNHATSPHLTPPSAVSGAHSTAGILPTPAPLQPTQIPLRRPVRPFTSLGPPEPLRRRGSSYGDSDRSSSGASDLDRRPGHPDAAGLAHAALADASGTRFPVSARGRCTHREDWLRLRGKRGFTYFLCTKCMLGWRKPRDIN
eukprot:EG_transcript_11744